VIRAAVTVTDAEGAVVADLMKSNFSIYEDDEARMTVSVEPDVSAVYASLALDYSGSMVAARAIADGEDAAKRFVDLLGPQDWGRIIKFANGVCGITEGFANDKVVLTADIDNPSMACKDTATWLYDAIYQAVSDTADQPGRKAVVVMTDGRDQRTKPGRSATEVISHALANGVPVFTIGLGAEVDEPVLTTIAVQTGGVYYFAPASGDLEAIYRKIAGVLKSQYIVSYETAVCELEGAANQEHELEILVVDGASAGQGAKRFSCPPVCGAQTGEGAAP
jgi:VWFA-related protein